MCPSPVRIHDNVVRFLLAAARPRTDLNGDGKRRLLFLGSDILGPDSLGQNKAANKQWMLHLDRRK